MAKKRMFDKEIINTDNFLDLPISTKAVYFLLGMEADDEGFVTPKKVLRLYGGSEDDLKILIMKGFVIPFESGVVVITDWFKNNWLDRRRITETIYQKEKQLLFVENQGYSLLAKPLLSGCLESVEENSIEENIYSTTSTKAHAREEEPRVEDLEDEPLMGETLVEDIFTYLEKAWGRTLSPYEYELLQEWNNDEITRYAIKESVKCNARSIKYVERIVENLKAKGIKTEAEAIKESDNFKSRQNKVQSETKQKKVETKPDWFNKKIEGTVLTDDEIKEMEKRMKEIE